MTNILEATSLGATSTTDDVLSGVNLTGRRILVTGVSAYVGDGHNRWPAAHVLDTARLYRLALEKGTAGARYHAIAEEGVQLKGIATAIGRGLNIPVISISQEQAREHFGFFGFFAGRDSTASSAQTREQLGWSPSGPDLLTDLATMRYTEN